ncbi:hypothetical protein GBA52_022788 [Prunus armeniaca]|nr:hypothetical protein GBA52_022788 [Prunus armeniaca]
MQSDRRHPRWSWFAMQGGGRPCKVVGAIHDGRSLPYTWRATMQDGRRSSTMVGLAMQGGGVHARWSAHPR